MSLRARLVVGMVVVGLVLVVAAGAIARTTEADMVDQVDAQLRAMGSPARITALGRLGRPAPDRDTTAASLSSLYVALVEPDGTSHTLLVPNLVQDSPALPDVEAADVLGAPRTGRLLTVGSDGSDERYRVLARTVPRSGNVLVTALPLAQVDSAVERLVTVQVVATVLVLAVLGLVTYWVLRLGVAPVKRMTATAAAIAAGDLSQRVPDVAPGTEAGDLGLALNRMMGRIEEAFDERARSEARLRQFAADASHELRTPVTTIRGYAELYRTGGLDDPDELGEAMRRTEQEAVRMGALIEDLLLLARLDQGRPLGREPVRLGVVAEDVVRDARAIDPDREITATVEEVVVDGDDDRLRQVVANLVGNALVHTPDGTPVEVSVRRDGAAAVLVVTDHGPGMGPEHTARAFERFYRADPSRSRHRGGTGLGLSIVQATVAAHGGEVDLESTPGRGTTVRVVLPAGDSA